MKKFMSLLLSVVMLIGIVGAVDLSACADDTVYASVDFKYVLLEDGTAQITDYIGVATDLTIPSELDGYRVTSIRYAAFSDCTSLESVTICNGITEIPYHAFYNCYNLKNVIIPYGVTTIGQEAFCYAAFEKLDLPNSVTTIREYAFSGSKLTEITIPDSVTEINEYSFINCDLLMNIYVDSENAKYTSVDGVLYSKDKTWLIKYPSGRSDTYYCVENFVKSIYAHSIQSDNIECVEVPYGIEIIDWESFLCPNLKTVILPNSLKNIYNDAFRALEEIYYNGTVAQWDELTQAAHYWVDGGYEEIINSVIHCDDFVIDCKNNIHYYTESTVEPTCQEDGTLWKKCHNCGYEYGTSIQALGHSFTNYISNNDATCTTDGTKTAKCDRCDVTDTVTDVGSATGHSYVYQNTTEPTCTANGYDTYKCSVCGATEKRNTVSSTGHNYEIQTTEAMENETGYYITYTCIDCGETHTDTCTLNLADFKIKTVSLSLESSIAMNFKVLKTALDGFDNPCMIFECGKEEIKVTDYTQQGDYLVFSYTGIAPQMMNDNVSAVLCAEHNGITYKSEEKSMSVKAYAEKLLPLCTGSGYEKLRTLLVDLLNYGAAAQIYMNYETDSLVNAELTEEQKSWATAEDPVLESISDKSYETVESPTVQWKAAGLVLNNSVMLRAKLTAQSTESLTVKISCNGRTFTYTGDELVSNGDGTYYVYCDEIYANEMSEKVLFTVYDNGVQCSNTMLFSAESYAKAVNDNYPGTALNELTKAMMRYGYAAKAYGA